jgi:hypothetical protein
MICHFLGSLGEKYTLNSGATYLPSTIYLNLALIEHLLEAGYVPY